MSKPVRPQIIEVFEVEPSRPMIGDATGTTSAAVQPPGEQDATRRWWIVAAAIAAIAALIGGAAVLAGSDNGSRSATSTTPPSTSVAGADAVTAVPTTPEGYAVESVQRATAASPTTTGFVRELYATHVDSALRSSWLMIVGGPTGGWYATPGDARVVVPAGVAVFGNRPDGALTLSGPVPGGGAVIASSGVSRATVQELLADLRFTGGRLVHTDSRLGGMFQRVAADGMAQRPNGSQDTVTVSYAASPDDSFSVTTGPLQSPSEEVIRRFFLSHPTPLVVAGQQLVVGADSREHGVTSVVLERDGRQVTVSGTAPRSVIADAARTVHIAAPSELEALTAAARQVVATPAPPSTMRIELAAGRLSSGRPWDLSVNRTPVPGPTPATPPTAADWQIVSANIATDAGPTVAPLNPQTASIAIIATPQLTAVVAFVPRNLDGAALVVTVGGVARTITPVAIGPGDLVAGYAFDELAPFTAEIVADGRAISSASG